MNTDDGGMWISWKRENVTFPVHRVLSSEQMSSSGHPTKPEQLSDIHCWFLLLLLSTHILWKFGLSASCLSSSIIIASHIAFSPHTLHLHIFCLQQKTETINQQSFSVPLHYSVLISDKTHCSHCCAALQSAGLRRLQNNNSQVREESNWSSSGCKIQFYISETISQRWVFSLFWGVLFFFSFSIMCDCLQHQRLHHSFHTRVCETPEVQELLINPQRTKSATLFRGTSRITWSAAPQLSFNL